MFKNAGALGTVTSALGLPRLPSCVAWPRKVRLAAFWAT